MSQVIYIPRRNIITTINYGALYNWYAATDSRKITSSDTWFVPTFDQWNYVSVHLGGDAISGKHLKENSAYWSTSNIGADNSVKFNGRGTAWRAASGSFAASVTTHAMYLSLTEYSDITQYRYIQLQDVDNGIFKYHTDKKAALGIRLFRNCTTEELSLPDGSVSATYTGNDGKIYRCCKIGNYIITADNLAETKFRDGSWIPGFDGGTYTPISNAAWTAATSAMMCVYNNDLSKM